MYSARCPIFTQISRMSNVKYFTYTINYDYYYFYFFGGEISVLVQTVAIALNYRMCVWFGLRLQSNVLLVHLFSMTGLVSLILFLNHRSVRLSAISLNITLHREFISPVFYCLVVTYITISLYLQPSYLLLRLWLFQNVPRHSEWQLQV